VVCCIALRQGIGCFFIHIRTIRDRLLHEKNFYRDWKNLSCLLHTLKKDV
jgi:hypothetical protein